MKFKDQEDSAAHKHNDGENDEYFSDHDSEQGDSNEEAIDVDAKSMALINHV